MGRMRRRNESFAIKRNSKLMVGLTRNTGESSVQETNYDRAKNMCLTELSPTNWLFEDAGVPDAAVYHIDFGLGVGKNASDNSLADMQNQMLCPRQENEQELQKKLAEKCEESIVDQKIQKFEEQLDKMRDEMKNQTQIAVKQLVEENRESFREIRRDMTRINRRY